MIGVARRVLEAMLADVSQKHLTHKVLTTLMAEVSAIINARPLVPVSNDPEADEVLTTAKLLTHKPQHLKPPAEKFSPENLSQTMETRPTPCRCFLVAMEERVPSNTATA